MYSKIKSVRIEYRVITRSGKTIRIVFEYQKLLEQFERTNSYKLFFWQKCPTESTSKENMKLKVLKGLIVASNCQHQLNHANLCTNLIKSRYFWAIPKNYWLKHRKWKYSVFVTDFSKERIVFVNQKLNEYRIEYTIRYLTIRKNEQFELFVQTLLWRRNGHVPC